MTTELMNPPAEGRTSQLPSVRSLRDVGKDDVASVGGKGANLGAMTSAALPVPPGFVVTVTAYERAMSSGDTAGQLARVLGSLNVDDTQALEKAATDAQAVVRAAPVPDAVREEILTAYRALSEGTDALVAVRSSATAEDAASASFAGMFESFLLVRGADDLLSRIRDCWASTFSARALFYRARQKLPVEMPVAVVVQRMILADKSGVMFTADPAAHDLTRIVIEASWGLGEPVVQGQVTPDRYVLDKTTLALEHLQVATKNFMLVANPTTGAAESVVFPDSKRVLTDEELAALGALAVKTERHFGVPQDLEFAIEGTAVYLVQTRPITTLAAGAVSEGGEHRQTDNTPLDAARSDARVLLRGLGASPGMASGKVRIIEKLDDGTAMQSGDVLVSRMTSPDWVPLMRRSVAIVTDSGGMTSHAAIVSRELGVPCVVGTREGTQVLRTGAMVTVDGSAGTVTSGATARIAGAGREVAGAGAPPAALAATVTRLYVNLADPAQAEAVAARDVDGVGLLRAESMLVEALDGVHPRALLADGKRDALIEKLAAPLVRIARAFHPRPVIYRAIDFRTNEFRALKGGERYEPEEANPMIGYRGCFRYVNEPDLFAVELLALHEARSQSDNLHLMIPFVRTEWELRSCLEIVAHSPLSRHRGFMRWIMAEVPSVVWRLDAYAALGIDGVSIGTNDLTQLMLGVDRDNERLASLYDERDPAVLSAIGEIVARAHQAGMTASICGQAPSVHEEYADHLVEFGIDSISVVPDAIDRTRRNIARAEQRLLLERARERTPAE